MYYATEKEMEKLDMLAVEQGLEIRQMMELAGWHIVSFFNLLEISKSESVVVVCGKGNKGGDGLSAVRHLINHGWSVKVVLLSGDISSDSKHHLLLLEKMEVEIVNYIADRESAEEQLNNANVLIDALVGYHLDGPLRGEFREVVELINNAEGKVISYDLPTGVDATTGECYDPCVKAYATLTLALPKRAFQEGDGGQVSGKIYLADIGIPAFLYDQIKEGSRPEFEEYNGLISL